MTPPAAAWLSERLARAYMKAIVVGWCILSAVLAWTFVSGSVMTIGGGEVVSGLITLVMFGAPFSYIALISYSAIYRAWREHNDPDAFFDVRAAEQEERWLKREAEE